LIHPQIASAIPSSYDIVSGDNSVVMSAAVRVEDSENSMSTAAAAAAPATEDSAATLPEAPAAMLGAVGSQPPVAFLKSGQPIRVSVAQLQAENRRKQMMWTGLTVATSSAAMFDAISTRRAITRYGAVEMNPLLKPFAGNNSLFAAIQVAPALLDVAGRKMMYSRHNWVRRVWWVPQSASFVGSILCGAHNLSYR
jgi:hypothetical protein